MSKGVRKPRFQWIKKHKKLSIFLGILIVIILLCLRGCAATGQVGAVVTTQKPTRGDLQESVSISGVVEAEQVKHYFAPASGTVEKLNVAPGDAVAAGDVLIAYDSAELAREMRQAQLEQDKAKAAYNGALADNSTNQKKLNEANTNLAVLEQQIADHKAYLKDLQSKLNQNQRDTHNALSKENYDLSRKLEDLDPTDDKYKKVKKDLERNSYLLQIADSTDYVTEMQDEIARVQEALADFESYKAEMQGQKNGSEASVLDGYDKVRFDADDELAQIAYNQAQDAYNAVKNGVVAQFDGIVTSVEVVEGAPVASGTKLLTLESSNEVKVSLSASKHDVAKLAIGQLAEVKISDIVYTGKVSKIDRMAMANASNNPMVGVEIHLDEPDDKIILGMDAKVVINTKKEENAILIPVEAINADKDGDFLYVIENGVATVKRVVCGISNDTYAVILEGITENDEVIVTSMTGAIEEGMPVTAVPEM